MSSYQLLDSLHSKSNTPLTDLNSYSCLPVLLGEKAELGRRQGWGEGVLKFLFYFL